MACPLTVGCSHKSADHKNVDHMDTDLRAWLDEKDVELENAVVVDIDRHLETLKARGVSFYGFAAVPGDYMTQPNPAYLTAAYNLESDIDTSDSLETYYRYSVDEWKHSINDGFDATNKVMELSFAKFKSMHQRGANAFTIDQFETAFIERTNNAIIRALKKLKESGRFNEGTYLSIWFRGSGYAITGESVRLLNSKEVYNTYTATFN